MLETPQDLSGQSSIELLQKIIRSIIAGGLSVDYFLFALRDDKYRELVRLFYRLICRPRTLRSPSDICR
jgi:hypothetical protein